MDSPLPQDALFMLMEATSIVDGHIVVSRHIARTRNLSAPKAEWENITGDAVRGLIRDFNILLPDQAGGRLKGSIISHAWSRTDDLPFEFPFLCIWFWKCDDLMAERPLWVEGVHCEYH